MSVAVGREAAVLLGELLPAREGEASRGRWIVGDAARGGWPGDHLRPELVAELGAARRFGADDEAEGLGVVSDDGVAAPDGELPGEVRVEPAQLIGTGGGGQVVGGDAGGEGVD